jgi:hypothetical protein
LTRERPSVLLLCLLATNLTVRRRVFFRVHQL